MWRPTIFVLISILHLSTSASLCGPSNETPFHNNVPPMTTPSPFSIVTSVSTTHQSETLTLRIKSVLSELKVGGFIVHAISTSRGGEILGRFTSSRFGSKLSSCDGEDNIATYHAYPDGVDEVELQWEAPNDYVGEIVFNATVAQDYDTFWYGITSNPLEVVPNEVSTLEDNFSPSKIPSDQINQLQIEPRSSALIYEGCGTKKTCFGFPDACMEERSCEAVVTATNIDNRFFFEMQSTAAGVGYIALALSRAPRMGDCSVMECVQEDGNIRQYTSWNFARSNTRELVPQDITSMVDSSYVNGTIYCKIERSPSTVIRDTRFDLPVERFYFLIAYGTAFTPTTILRHDLNRTASATPLAIIRQGIDPIYQGCGPDKTCFGLPQGCVSNASCTAVVAVLVEDGRYEFELQSDVAGAAYVAFGLSRDTIMGDDSVIECVQESGTIRAFTSWNTPRPDIGSTRVGLQQGIITMLNSSFYDGKIYCKVRRDKSTYVLEQAFNLGREDFHFMLAVGTSFTANNVMRHDLGHTVSEDTFVLPGRISAAPYVRISAIAIVTWLLATSCVFRGL